MDKFGQEHWRATILGALALHPDVKNLTKTGSIVGVGVRSRVWRNGYHVNA